MDESFTSDDVFDPAEIITFPPEAVPCPGPDGMKMAWGNGSELMVFCEGNGEVFPLAQRLNRQLHDHLEFDVCRELLQRFHTIFMNLQEMIRSLQSEGFEGSEIRRRQEISTASRNYFEAMVDAIAQLRRESDDALAEEKLEELERMWMVWHLAHILFIVCVRGASVQKFLREWIGLHTVIAEDDSFWDKFTKMLLIGKIDAALNELRTHRQTQNDPELVLLEKIVRHMPLFDENDSMTKRHEWNRWREEVMAKEDELKTGGVIPEHIFGILSGDMDTLREMSSTWYEYGVAQVMYVVPVSRASNLPEMVDDWIVAMNTEESDFDAVLAAIFEYDASKLLVESLACFKSTWYTAHMADILGHIGVFGVSDQLRYGSDLREWFLLDYGTELMEVGQDMWMFGCGYLGECRMYGLRRMATCIARVVPQNEKDARKMISFCRKYGLKDTESTLVLRMGNDAWRAKNYGRAMIWFLQSGDDGRVQKVADKLVDMCIDNREEDRAHLKTAVDILSRHGGYSDRVTFMVKYCQFREHVESQGYKPAAKLLVDMFENDMVPMHHRHRLLFNDINGQYDALSLLTHDNDVFTAPEASLLLRYMEDLRLSPHARPWEVSEPVDVSRVLEFRKLLAANLANSLLVAWR